MEAAKHKCINIKGHPSNPGIRVSIYNAMPVNGVVILCRFLDEFRKANPIEKQTYINQARL
jgi:phosphoserine aminotransferase